MAFADSGLKLLVPGVGSGPGVWYYKGNDAHATVSGASFFTTAGKRGMKSGDIVVVINENGGTTTIHHVTSIASGAATISSATLA